MNPLWFQTLVSVTIVSLLSLLVVMVLWLQPRTLQKLLIPLISLAVGGLFGDAFLHLIPDCFQNTKDPSQVSLLILGGLLLFLTLEKSMHYYHHHQHEEEEVHPYGYLSLIAGGLHNYIDGLLIGASYLAGFSVGLATTLAVILHEIPHELGDFSILVKAGFKPLKALFFNFFSALLAIAGALTALALSIGNPESVTRIILPMTAGGFIYIAGSDLIPELHKEKTLSSSLVQILSMIAGAGLMLLIKLLE